MSCPVHNLLKSLFARISMTSIVIFPLCLPGKQFIIILPADKIYLAKKSLKLYFALKAKDIKI